MYPLLKFDAAILAVTAVVCGSRLITGVMDEQMNRGLVELVGSTVKRSMECRKVTCAHINLMNLVITSEEAEQAHAGVAFESASESFLDAAALSHVQLHGVFVRRISICDQSIPSLLLACPWPQRKSGRTRPSGRRSRTSASSGLPRLQRSLQ